MELDNVSGTKDVAVVCGSTLDLQGFKITERVKPNSKFYRASTKLRCLWKIRISDHRRNQIVKLFYYLNFPCPSPLSWDIKTSPRWMWRTLCYEILRRTAWYTADWSIKVLWNTLQFVPCNMMSHPVTAYLNLHLTHYEKYVMDSYSQCQNVVVYTKKEGQSRLFSPWITFDFRWKI
jgi:hypothetical protein